MARACPSRKCAGPHATAGNHGRGPARLQRHCGPADHVGVEIPAHRTPVIAAAVLLVLLAFGWRERAQRLDAQNRASAAASRVAGRPVTVRCPGILKRAVLEEINHGTVRFRDGRPEDVTHLSGEACAGLRRLVREGAALDLACLQLDACDADDTRVALGVSVLAHEAVHLRGVIDEARTECESVRWTAGVAEALGATPRTAAFIADWKFSVGPDHLPQQYQTTADCRVAPKS